MRTAILLLGLFSACSDYDHFIYQPDLLPTTDMAYNWLVFVTSQSFNGTFTMGDCNQTGVAGADCQCAAAAASGSNTRERTFRAYLAVNTDGPAVRIRGSGPWLLVGSGIRAADSPTAIPLMHGINEDEFGRMVPAETDVWTGANVDFTVANANCSDWTKDSAAQHARVGWAGAATSDWVSQHLQDCSQPARLYCWEVPANQ
jgi:hypothetical protein